MSESKVSQPIVIPTDFTHVVEKAIDHAVMIARQLNNSILFLHVVESEKDKAESDQKLQTLAERTQATFGIECAFETAIGSYFTEIGRVASEQKASYVVMGTHGIRGIQKFIGSYALRVITNSESPFIVVQEKEAPSGYHNIVIGIDFEKEDKQKVVWASKIAQTFSSKVHIISAYESDEFSRNKVEMNVAWAKGYLKEHEVAFEIHELDKNSASLGKEVIRYAVKNNIDLIVAMTTLEKGLSEFLFGPEEQYMIANEPMIPVMCFNPIDFTVNNASITAH